jgi:alkylation response protein AidB-like acyl-CoA dehydrogenase
LKFGISSDQQMLFDSAQRFVKDRYSPSQRKRLIETGENHWKDYSELGWLGVGVPEEFGGIGTSPGDIAVLCQALGRGLILEPYLGSAVLASQVLLAGATKDQCVELFPQMIDGTRVIALANNESPARGRLDFIETVAHRSGDGYVLNGFKTCVIAGPYATHLLIAARTSGAAEQGISLFLLDADSQGLRRTDYFMIDHMAVSDVELDRVAIPASALIGSRDCAYEALERGTHVAIVAAAADAIGSMDESLSLTCDYLGSRHQFGSPLSEFQALRHRVADMRVAFELAKSSLLRALNALDSADRRTRIQAVSSVKLAVSQAGRLVGRQAVQLHGGVGLADDFPIGHHFMHLAVLDSLFGTDEHHINCIGRLLDN